MKMGERLEQALTTESTRMADNEHVGDTLRPPPPALPPIRERQVWAVPEHRFTPTRTAKPDTMTHPVLVRRRRNGVLIPCWWE